MMGAIDLAFCLQQRGPLSPYPMALAALYISIRQRTSASLCLHVVHDDSLSDNNRKRLEVSLKCGDKLIWYHADRCPEAAGLGRQLQCDFSAAMIWRAWLPDYLSHLPRCLSMDCDLICLMDVEKLWQMELSGACISAPLRGTPWSAAYHEYIRTPPDRYFRNGVCLMELSEIRMCSEFMLNRSRFLAHSELIESKYQSLVLWEQSLFNYYFSASFQPMPIQLIPVDRLAGHPRELPWRQALDHGEDLILDIKGWANKSPQAQLFWQCLLQTPWACVAESQLETDRNETS